MSFYFINSHPFPSFLLDLLGFRHNNQSSHDLVHALSNHQTGLIYKMKSSLRSVLKPISSNNRTPRLNIGLSFSLMTATSICPVVENDIYDEHAVAA
jgi:hypothetical protein